MELSSSMTGIEPGVRQDGIHVGQPVLFIDRGKTSGALFLPVVQLNDRHPGDVLVQERVDLRDGNAHTPVGIPCFKAKHCPLLPR